jgi:D-alanyl-D-alanine carboxypeptidase
MVVCGVAFSRARVLGVISSVAVALVSSAVLTPADASPRKKQRAAAYSPPYAALVIDANSGRVLHATNENALRHPASITKVMTLYLLFEQLERGRFRLDSQIPISAYAASQPPTKVGLRAGSTISVENAIGALITKSANDIAVAVAEAIAGDEDDFARLMTRKAQSLGMTRTVFRNASGLPDAQQVTTARDLTILGRAIQDRFPRQFAYFGKTEHRMGGRVLRNHNRLLSRLEYVDGIKTGYIRSSGFNVLTSAKLDGRRVVAVVLGGRTAGHRDSIMANLVENHIEKAARTRTAPMIAEGAPAERVAEAAAPPAPVQRVAEVRPEPPAARPPAPEPARAAPDSARPAVVSAAPRDDTATAAIRPSVNVGATPGAVRANATPGSATPSTLRWVSGPRGIPTGVPEREAGPLTPPAPVAGALNPPAPIPGEKIALRAENPSVAVAAPTMPISSAAAAQASAPTLSAAARPPAARNGVMIQVGATDDQEKAQALLSRARAQTRSLASAQPFTEKVQRGGETLWRARFAGLEADEAESACRALKRSGFACFTTRN